MPHCIIEYSSEIEVSIGLDTLLNTVHDAAINSGLFSVNDIKTRALPFTQRQTILACDSFIHVSLHILSGRTIEQRKALSTLMVAALNTLALESISISASVVELERESYTKIIK